MKRVIFLMLFVAVIGCHESNSVEPVLDNSAQLNRLDDVNGTLDNPLKNGEAKVTSLLCNYNFNPYHPRQNCGEVVNGSLDYVVDGLQRYIKNVVIKAPSTVILDGKRFETFNYYTFSRVENINSAGKLLNGTTKGTFKITDRNNVEMFHGKYSGEIFLNKTTIRLKGEGLNSYADKYLLAEEIQNCSSVNGKLHCWRGVIRGSILPSVVHNED